MRILMVGAGAVGGYFGGRLLEKGEDVTFFVRPRREQQLREGGLVIRSIHGNFQTPVCTLTPGGEAEAFDLAVLAVKAYHLDRILEDVRPYIGSETMVLPLLNGLTHLDKLDEAFSPDQVLGGLCFIETTLTAQGEIEQYSDRHDLMFGERDGSVSDRIRRLEKTLNGARMNAVRSDNILMEMWKKYLFISTFSGITSLMNSAIGPILETEYGSGITRRLLDEIAACARHREPSLNDTLVDGVFKVVSSLAPQMKSSMLRDIEKGSPVEADHLHGELLRMAGDREDLPLLRTVYTFLKTYEANRLKETKAAL
ncbi:ketopantoate reductase [Melghirimyces profundicolus]|uniref:2-dehydropantoate 2-reductase n=1 Tax=Melghirimyces profundicolus TaxID=1242148 RepID=A0A2T6B605_9BACL|nr:ketopantoate reductase family protein [Melghirimyces profundicolus]PTX51472.1 ketopantoate reductase [Melghirimyces profundicolus]